MTPEDRPDPFYGDAARRAGGAGRSGFGLGRGHGRGELDDAFAYVGDPAGVGRWAAEQGWVRTSDDPPVVAEVLDAAPVPLGTEHVAGGIVAGRYAGWDGIAFDVGLRTSAGTTPTWAVTAVGRAAVGQAYRLHPRRLGRFRPGPGWTSVDLPPADLAARWTLSARGSGASALRAALDHAVVQALLATDDGDELWATETALAAVRPDGHRPALVEHHLVLLTTLAEAERIAESPR